MFGRMLRILMFQFHWSNFSNWRYWEKTEIVRVHTQFHKRQLGVNRSASNALIKADLQKHLLLEQVTIAKLS